MTEVADKQPLPKGTMRKGDQTSGHAQATQAPAKKIMIVDDLLFTRKMLREMLANGGYTEVIEASDGTTAFELYCKERPDLVIMDIVMPHGGIDTLEKIMEKDRQAKVIVMSIIGEQNIMKMAIKKGAAGYLIKPLKEDKVLEAVKNALEG